MIPNAEGSLRHRCIESQTSAVVKFDIRFVFSSPPSRLRRAKLSKVPGKFMHFIWRCPLSKLEKNMNFKDSSGHLQVEIESFSRKK